MWNGQKQQQKPNLPNEGEVGLTVAAGDLNIGNRAERHREQAAAWRVAHPYQKQTQGPQEAIEGQEPVANTRAVYIQ